MTSPAPENIPAEPKSPAKSRIDSLNISSSVGNLRFINDELRSHVTKLRNQLEAEKGNLKQAHRQKVLDIKNVREQEQKKALATIIELKKKFHEEKMKEMENVRETVSQKLESEKNKSLKVKDTEMIKLRQELDVKEKMLNKLLSQTYPKTSNDQIKVKLLDELSELRSTKRQLEESLSQATVIEKHHSENLKKLCSSYESELVRVRREAHMEIRHMIEELKTKEKHISQLEQDIGHQSGYMMQLEKKISSQDKGPNPLSPGGATTPSKPPTTAHNYSPSKDSDGNQQTNLKETSSSPNSKNKVPGYLTRKADKENSTFLAQIRSLQQKISEQYKTINALRQTCSEKDRRIELIQHRKMKKRLRRSLEKCGSTNGDDDACSVDSEVSISSLPMDNGTDDNQLDIWDEYAREDLERNYRQIMREHLELKKSYTLLQAQTSSALDPERELKLCRTLESDLFEAQCKIEELKALLQIDGLEPRLLEEKETLQSANVQMQKKLKIMEDNEGELQEDLSEAKEEIEDLEFRILELEGSQNTSLEDGNDDLEDFFKPDNIHQLNGDDESNKTSVGTKRSLFSEDSRGGDGEPASLYSNESGEDEQLLREEVNSLRKQIIELTERPVMDFPPKPTKVKTEATHPIETKDDKNLQKSKQRIEELEKIAIELQGKIIGLQQDKVQLEECLTQTSCTNLKLDKESTDGEEVDDFVSQVNETVPIDNSVLSYSPQDTVFNEVTKTNETPDMKHLSLGDEEEVDDDKLMSNSSQVKYEESDDDVKGSGEDYLEQDPYSTLEDCHETTMADYSTVNEEMKRKRVEDSWKEIESAVIDETIAELAAGNNNNSSSSNDSSSARSGDCDDLASSLDIGNSLLADTEGVHDNDDIDDDDDEDENLQLLEQQSECLESIKQILSEQGILSHVEMMLQEMEEIKEENTALKERLTSGDVTLASGEVVNIDMAIEKLHQLEEVCENLRDKVHTTEQSEILLKTKLKHAEDTVGELESSENLLKEQLAKISQREAEWKTKAQGLLRNVSELEQLLKEKDSIEEKLYDKIKALEEADLKNNRKLVELQEDENHLRESLRSKDDLSDQTEMLKTQKKKIKDLEKCNKLLKSKIVELEESECEMREHWNQIVKADANKIECLQEKMKMLESLNKELEKKVQEGEEEFMTGVSLASELSFSQDPPDSKESTVSFDFETEYKNLEEKFQEVTEAKNNKIAELEDHLEKLYSTQQKLSETIGEMEERERELLAKLKLCENSDFSVEKMLNYEDRIKELSYSQENLLNAIDTVADPESHSLQIITALKDELVLSYQKNDEMSLKEKIMTEQFRNENNSLKNQLDKLIEKESSHLEQIPAAVKGKDSLHNEHSLASQNNKQEVPTSSLFVRIQELEIENQELRAKVDGSQNGTFSKVSSTVSSNYERLCELEKENSDLLAEASRLREAECQWKDTAETMVQLENNEERLMEKVVELEDSCESLKEELRKVQGDKKENQSELKEEREKVGSLLKLEAEIKGRLQAEEELNSSLREQLQSFRLRLEEIKNAYADHEHSKMELEKRLEEVTRDKNLLTEKLQSLTKNQIIPVDSKDPNQNSADHDNLEHSSVSLCDGNHSSANTNSLPFHSTENKYLGLINSLEASLKDIGSNHGSSEFQDNKQGPITQQASESKEDLSKELEAELVDMSREQLVDICNTLQTDLRAKSQKIEEFERDFSDFVKRVRCGTVVFRDKEVRKTVHTEVKTFQQQCNCKVPINMHTTLAGEKVSQGVDTADLLTNVAEQQQQQQQQQEDASNTVMAHIDMPQSEYKEWKAKVAILTDIEANLPNVKEQLPHQLELLLQILQKGRDIICSDDQVGISNDKLLIYAKQLQTLSQGLNSATSPHGTGTDAGKEVSRVKMEQLGAGKEVKGPCPKTSGLFNTASKSDRRKVIKELISNLSSEDLVVVAQIVKQRLAKGKVKTRVPDQQSIPSKSIGQKKEFEEIEVDMWLSSEDEDVRDGDEGPFTEVEQVQAGTDSVPNAAALPCMASNTATAANGTKASTEEDDEWKPPLPKTPPPDQPPMLLDEPEVIFVDGDVTDKHLTEAEPTLPSASVNQRRQEQQQHIPQTANTNDQSKQQVNLLTKALNDKNKYITMLETSIEKLGQMLAQPHGSNPDAGVREETIKKLGSQLKSLQQELRQHHVEGQQSLTSLRTQLQGNTDINNTQQKRQSFPQCHPQKPTPLAHSYSTTDLSRISFSASDMDNLLKMPPHPIRTWPSCSHLAPQTFSRTVRRRSDTFDSKLLPAGQQQQQQQHQLLLQGNHGNIPVSTISGWSSDKTSLHHQQPKSQMLATNSLFVAASDYSPELFSASGHLHLEIPLKEGDVVIKKGPVGANGYCEALVKGKVGLVPYKYLHPIKLETMTAEEQRALRLQFRGNTIEATPEHMRPPTEAGSYFQKAHLTSIPNVPGSQYLQPEHTRWNNSVTTTPPHTSVSAAPTTSPTSQFVKRHSSSGGGGGHISHTPAKGLPEAPSTFRLERLVGDNSVLLSWHPPMMDELDQNNGMQLIGYRIFLNGRLCQQPGSAHLAKAVVENLDLSRPQYFAIQSVAANGQNSPSAEVVFEGLERWLDGGDKSTESDTDLSEILPSPLGNPGPQRTFVAIYDYNPTVQSPHDYAEFELRFDAGDLITVFGNQRSDGFFWAELNGSQGLVPASFVEEVPMKGSWSKPVSRQNSNASQKSLQNTVGRTST